MLRSIRYGEADRVLHLYSATRGRIGAIAKGVRKPRSRFGGRLEPFFRLDLVLHEGRGDLSTVTAAHTIAAHPNLRSDGAGARRRRPRLRRGPAPLRRRGAEPGRLQPALPLPRDPRRLGVGRAATAAATAPPGSRRRSPSGSSWRWRRGSRPSSARARAAARPTGSPASPAPPAEWSAPPASATASRSRREAHGFMVEALGRPLAQAPAAGDRALRQAERAISRDARASRPRPASRRGLSRPVGPHTAQSAMIRSGRISARDDQRSDLLEALGGPQGIADSSLPALAFVVAYTADGNELEPRGLGGGRASGR